MINKLIAKIQKTKAPIVVLSLIHIPSPRD